jgi:hypothetical protein
MSYAILASAWLPLALAWVVGLVAPPERLRCLVQAGVRPQRAVPRRGVRR